MPDPQPDRSLGVIAFGNVGIESFATLEPLFGTVELLELDVPPRDPLLAHRALIHDAVDASGAKWFLILRERETVDAALAAEIDRAVSDTPRAWGYRVRTQPTYAGKPLLLGGGGGEIRLFHRRHGRFDKEGKEPEMRVQGTVVRLEQSLHAVTYASPTEHRAWLARHGVPHSLLRRLLLFAHDAIVTGAWRRSRATLRYLWIEAGYDRNP